MPSGSSSSTCRRWTGRLAPRPASEPTGRDRRRARHDRHRPRHEPGHPRFVRVGKNAARPPTDLIPEQPEPSREAHTDGPFGDDASGGAPVVGDRGALDDPRRLGDPHDESRVEQLRTRSSGEQRRRRLVDRAHVSDDTAACAERDPEQIHGGGRGVVHAVDHRRNGGRACRAEVRQPAGRAAGRLAVHEVGAGEGIRTPDLPLTRRLLCH